MVTEKANIKVAGPFFCLLTVSWRFLSLSLSFSIENIEDLRLQVRFVARKLKLLHGPLSLKVNERNGLLLEAGGFS